MHVGSIRDWFKAKSFSSFLNLNLNLNHTFHYFSCKDSIVIHIWTKLPHSFSNNHKCLHFYASKCSERNPFFVFVESYDQYLSFLHAIMFICLDYSGRDSCRISLEHHLIYHVWSMSFNLEWFIRFQGYDRKEGAQINNYRLACHKLFLHTNM